MKYANIFLFSVICFFVSFVIGSHSINGSFVETLMRNSHSGNSSNDHGVIDEYFKELTNLYLHLGKSIDTLLPRFFYTERYKAAALHFKKFEQNSAIRNKAGQFEHKQLNQEIATRFTLFKKHASDSLYTEIDELLSELKTEFSRVAVGGGVSGMFQWARAGASHYAHKALAYHLFDPSVVYPIARIMRPLMRYQQFIEYCHTAFKGGSDRIGLEALITCEYEFLQKHYKNLAPHVSQYSTKLPSTHELSLIGFLEYKDKRAAELKKEFDRDQADLIKKWRLEYVDAICNSTVYDAVPLAQKELLCAAFNSLERMVTGKTFIPVKKIGFEMPWWKLVKKEWEKTIPPLALSEVTFDIFETFVADAMMVIGAKPAQDHNPELVNSKAAIIDVFKHNIQQLARIIVEQPDPKKGTNISIEVKVVPSLFSPATISGTVSSFRALVNKLELKNDKNKTELIFYVKLGRQFLTILHTTVMKFFVPFVHDILKTTEGTFEEKMKFSDWYGDLKSRFGVFNLNPAVLKELEQGIRTGASYSPQTKNYVHSIEQIFFGNSLDIANFLTTYLDTVLEKGFKHFAHICGNAFKTTSEEESNWLVEQEQALIGRVDTNTAVETVATILERRKAAYTAQALERYRTSAPSNIKALETLDEAIERNVADKPLEDFEAALVE